jgi:hypothetical protein
LRADLHGRLKAFIFHSMNSRAKLLSISASLLLAGLLLRVRAR